MPTRRWLQAGLFALLVACFAGCDELAGTTPGGAVPGPAPGSPESGPAEPTVVSLTPAITQMLIDMGKTAHIVGVSSDDRQLADLPRCGKYKNPVMAKILELEPDIVLTESANPDASDTPAMLQSLAKQGVFELKVILHSRSIADVERALIDTETGLGAAIGDAEAAEKARRLMATRLELIRAAVADAKPPRVLMLINPATLGAIGTGVTHEELLTRAGAVNATAQYKSGYLTLTRAQVQQQARPDVVLIFEPGGGPIVEGDPRTRALEGLAVPAVSDNRVVVISHPKAMLPSTALPEVLLEMAAAVHPDRADAIRQAYALAERVVDQAEAKSGDTR